MLYTFAPKPIRLGGVCTSYIQVLKLIKSNIKVQHDKDKTRIVKRDIITDNKGNVKYYKFMEHKQRCKKHHILL